MNGRFWAGLMMVWGLSSVIAEEPVPDVKLFALPRAELREAVGSGDPEKDEIMAGSELSGTGKGAGISTGTKEEFAAATESGTVISEARLTAFEMMNGRAVLSQAPRPAELGGAAGWVQQKVWDPVFAPEVVKLGKVKVTGGIVAAIKRKNPFCLLHPLVFAASW